MVWFGATSVINQPNGVEYIWMGQWNTISHGSKLFFNETRTRAKNKYELKKTIDPISNNFSKEFPNQLIRKTPQMVGTCKNAFI